MSTSSLYWPRYQMFPYERELAIAEATTLLRPRAIDHRPDRVVIHRQSSTGEEHLTYFAHFQRGCGPILATQQHILETESAGSATRQNTRYSVHGLHEYKGKFNPQVARALLNTAGVKPGGRLLDPFCGSGTTLIEGAQRGFTVVGVDINPLAVRIAKAKAAALRIDPDLLLEVAKAVVRSAARRSRVTLGSDPRIAYLRRWFRPATLLRLETLRLEIECAEKAAAEILLIVASNLLREFSLQEPQDLRIRRRRSPPTDRDLYEAFRAAVADLVSKLRVVRRHSRSPGDVRVAVGDSRIAALRGARFDAAITSPPYAMALPYIDTQRLSLVWLGLLEPHLLGQAQSHLIGSREFVGSDSAGWAVRMRTNQDSLPDRQARFCQSLEKEIGEEDGFRRKAVPSLLYRYLAGMRDSFRRIHEVLSPGAPFFLIVGYNHTTLSGRRIDLDTPAFLATLAETVGFEIDEHRPLQTYQRYGLHHKNAIGREDLLVLRAA